MSDLKVAFITGGNRGIGFETAREIGRTGVTVVIGSRDLGKGTAAAALLTAEGIAAESISFDASEPDSISAAYDHFDKNYGKLDILVNNAGVMFEPIYGNSAGDISAQTLRKTFDTNFFGVVATTQALLPLIRKSSAGRIVNVSSQLGSLVLHATKDSPIDAVKAFAYNSSKTALNSFTIHMANLLKDTTIKVNSAHPGWVKTELGGPDAQIEVSDGSKTSVRLALLSDDGPTGGFFHMEEALPW